MTPRAVPAHEADEWVPRIGWHLEQFAASGAATAADFIADIMDRQRQLWVVDDDGAVACVLLTSVAVDRFNTVQVTHCAGRNYEDWLHLWPVIEGWAREIGAGRIEVTARRGWERPLRKFGLAPTHTVLEKRL